MGKDIDVIRLLPNHLDKYVKELHTQEECIGFIDGFEKAIDLAKTDLLHNVIGSLDAKQLHSELKAYAKWYQMDEMRRTESERFDTIIDRYIEQKD